MLLTKQVPKQNHELMLQSSELQKAKLSHHKNSYLMSFTTKYEPVYSNEYHRVHHHQHHSKLSVFLSVQRRPKSSKYTVLEITLSTCENLQEILNLENSRVACNQTPISITNEQKCLSAHWS
jgi:hypothetical protein